MLGYDVILQSRANGEVNFTKGNITWHRLTDIHIKSYKAELESRLMNCGLSMDILQCCDVGCTRKSHMREIDLFCDDLISCVWKRGIHVFRGVKWQRSVSRGGTR